MDVNPKDYSHWRDKKRDKKNLYIVRTFPIAKASEIVSSSEKLKAKLARTNTPIILNNLGSFSNIDDLFIFV